MHIVAEAHDTPSNWMLSKPLFGPGVLWIDQLEPFQRSASLEPNAKVAGPPTAVHAVAAVQDTAPSVAPERLGVVWTVQVLPFQTSAKVLSCTLSNPTAIQAVAEVHDTPLRAPLPLGVLWTVQLLPSQPTAKVAPLELPTATHAVAAVHDTPLSVPPPPGVAWIAQVVPFQRSAKVRTRPALFVYDPTAVHAVADVHDTPFSWLRAAPAGAGVFWIDQLVPFQRSTRVTWMPVWLVSYPTAVHALAVVHDAPFSWLSAAPPGVAVFWIDHLEPCQTSAEVSSVPVLLACDPTAEHAEPSGHETPFSAFAHSSPPHLALGYGARWTVHLEPFQRSANGAPKSPASEPAVYDPTAVQADTDGHETAANA
jgi:hypothetical protein